MGEPYDYPGISFPTHTNSNIDITETYACTLDGRLKSLSSDVFSMELRSDEPILPGTLEDFSGKITEVEWANKHAEYGDPQAYSFQYDNWGQLYASIHFSDNPTFGSTFESFINYDLNGNILSKSKYYDGSRIENLTYGYSGNMLERINYGNPFEYDSNGNMTVDGRSGWKYEYNSLDLLEKAYDEDDNELAAYTWLASGQKVGVADPAGNGFVYLGSLQYVLRDGELSLESTGFGGGRIVACETTGGIAYEPLYFIRDHLGSVRAVISGGGTDGYDVVYNNYYPFGGRWSDTGEATTGRWLYNGKELQTTGGLGHLLDYGSRMYDPSLGRWFNTDPRSQFTSPYNFCGNSPLIMLDPNGESALLFAAAMGAVINVAIQGMSGNINSDGGFWKALGIGAASGLAGGAAGAAIGGAVATSFSAATTMGQFAGQGALVGLASGAASGFTGGTVNTLLNGGSMDMALKSGLKGALIGGASGAITGALSGMNQYKSLARDFSLLDAGQEFETLGDGSLSRSNKTLNNFSEKYFKEFIYRDKATLEYNHAAVKAQRKTAVAYTSNKLVNGKYPIKFANEAFNSKFTLFLTMGHEYVHVGQFMEGLTYYGALFEVGAWKWMQSVSPKGSKFLGTSIDYYVRYWETHSESIWYKEIISSYLHKSTWGLPTVMPNF